jgi:hypothetical protein
VFVTRGYDRWGNPRGSELANWSTTPNLHTPTRTDSVWRIFYETSQVVSGETGWLRAAGVNNTDASDSVYVLITEPPTRLIYALTLDTNANGYLDGLELHFLREVALPAHPTALIEDLLVENTRTGARLDAMSIIGAGGTMTDSVFVVSLREDSSGNVPQTSWMPLVSFSGLAGVTDADAMAAIDGAGPVVWRVTKYLTEGKPPRIEVVLSEPVQDTLGSALGAQTAVAELFNVYRYDETTDEFIPIEALLNGITLLSVEDNNSRLVFDMTNGKDLPTGSYMNLRMHISGSDTFFVLTDRSLQPGHDPNEPDPDNRKVEVQVRGSLPLQATPVPNPGRPSPQYVRAGEFDAGHHWDIAAYFTQGGTVTHGVNTQVVIPLPTEINPATGKRYEINAYRSIYDVAGNLVQTARSERLVEQYLEHERETEQMVLWFHWNGFNAQGKPAAPGMYREILYLDYEDPAAKDERKVLTYGIRR